MAEEESAWDQAVNWFIWFMKRVKEPRCPECGGNFETCKCVG